MRFFIFALCLVLVSCAPSQSTESPRVQFERLKVKEAQELLKVDHHEEEVTALESSELPPYQALPLNDPEIDAVHYRLFFDFPAESFAKPYSYLGEAQLTFKPLSDSYALLGLDSAGLAIERVTLLNTLEELRFEQRGERLEIDLARAYSASDTLTVSIAYRWAGWKGMYFRTRYGASGVEAMYTQSQPEDSRFWFPGNRQPNDRATFETIVRVPEPYRVLSNGALVSGWSDAGFSTFHWSQQIPMVSYLAVVTAGKFGVHEELWEDVPVQYWGPSDDMERVKHSLKSTPDMLTFFSRITGYRYPYEKYAQAVVPQYQSGGMEHTTATTLTDRMVHSPELTAEYANDSLVAHELAHQWFGDLVTCRGWDHIWLNEGFATYFDALYQEHVKGRAQLLETMARGSRWYFSQEEGDPRPVVFAHYRYTLNDFFDAHAYPKGAWVLHMLRNLIGEETFYKGIRRYLYRNQKGLVVTEDFRRAMEEVSQRDLGWFFEQWLLKPGFPKFKVQWRHESSGSVGEVVIDVAQVQDVTKPGGLAGFIPNFKGPIGIEVDGQVHSVELQAVASQSFRLPAANAPRYVRFNAENGWLAKVETIQSLEAWAAQLASSRDVTAKVQAAQVLGDSMGGLPALVQCARTEREVLVRVSCLEGVALQAMEDEASRQAAVEPLLSLIKDADWQVRKSVVYALQFLPASSVMTALRDVVKNDPSLKTVVQAVQAIGELKAPDAYDFLVAQLGRKSHQDVIGVAALTALTSLKDLRSFPIAEEHVTSRYRDEVRSAALLLLAAVGRATGESERARLAIEELLTDPIGRMRGNAVAALGELGNKNSIPALRRVAESDPEPRVRMAAAQVIRKLEK